VSFAAGLNQGSFRRHDKQIDQALPFRGRKLQRTDKLRNLDAHPSKFGPYLM
jgi:hypothetical protein